MRLRQRGSDRPGATLTLRQVNRATLARQHLLARERVTVEKALERLVAMQAQWPRPPFLGLWTRLEGFARKDLARVLEERRLVRATLLRATLHLTRAEDYLALRPVLQPMLEGSMQAILKAKGVRLDLARVVERARSLLSEEPRTFEDLRDLLLRAFPRSDERAMGYAVRMILPLVQVPVGDTPWAFPAQARFALADEWLGRKVPIAAAPPDPLVLRYLAAYGPARVADIQAWSGLRGMAEAVERLRPRLVSFRDEDGRELLDLPEAPRPDPDVPAPVRFVPDYDNLIATRADERVVARRDRPRIFLSALRIAPTVLVDGFAAGTWKIEGTKKRATLTIHPFRPLPAPARHQAIAEAESLLAFAEPEAGGHEVRISK